MLMYKLSISGLQEECPLLNESATMLLTKLQHDTRLLRYKIETLLSEKDAASHPLKYIEAWECGVDTKFKNEGILHLPPSFQAGILKQPLNSDMTNLQGNMIMLDCQQYTPENRNQYEDEARNVKKYPAGSVRRVPFGKSSEYETPIQNKDESVVKKPSDMKLESVPFDLSSEYITSTENEDESVVKVPSDMKMESVPVDVSSEYVMSAENEDAVGAMNVPDIEISRNSVTYFTDRVEDVTFVQFRDHDGVAKTHVELSDVKNVAEHEAVANVPFVIKDETNYVESCVKDDGVAQPTVQVKDKVSAFSVRDRDASLDHTVSTHFPEGDGVTEVNRNMDNLQPDLKQETYDWEEHNIKIIKSTLKLLQTPFDEYIISPDINSFFSFAVALASELEQSLVHLQKIITHCELQKTDFCAQFQKKMDVSVSKMKETAEGLVDDIDEHLYKLLTKIVQKLKKCKVNLQDKWCHFTNRYDCENDAVCNWLHSSVLLDCKESDRKTKWKLKHFLSKGPDKLHEKVLRSTSGENEKQTDVPQNILKNNIAKEEYDGFESVDLSTGSDADQKNSIRNADDLVLTPIIPDDRFFIDHDFLNEQHLERNIPMTVSKAFEKYSGQEQYMSKLYGDSKHDNQDAFKSCFSGKEKNKYENKHKNLPETRTCQHTICQKFKNNQQVLHSQKFKNKYTKHDHGENQWYEKRHLKNQINDKDKKEYKKQQTKHSLHDKNKNHKEPIIFEEVASSVLVDTSTPKQNVSGKWMLKMANSRAEQRRLEHRSDWLFERADARKLERERHRVTSSWYFQRARGREYCRYHPHSDWC
jgi:hypothetical protein